MRITLNKKAFEFAKQMIHEHKFSDKHGRADQKHALPTTAQEDDFLKNHSWEEFGRWYLGAHVDRPENKRERYDFAMGDFSVLHRSDLLHIKKKAHEYNYDDIADAAQQLVDLIDKMTAH
jgi:replication fork clamp-binding protein CrfC